MKHLSVIVTIFLSFVCISCQRAENFQIILELHHDNEIISMDIKALHRYETQLAKTVTFFEKNNLYDNAMLSLIKLGKVQIKVKKFLEAAISLRSALSYAEKLNDAQMAGEIYMLLASVYRISFEQAESIKCLINAERLFAETSDSLSRYKAMMNLGKTYMELQEYTESEKYFSQVIDWAKENNDSVILGKCMTEYAKTMIKKSSPQPRRAIRLMEEAEALYSTKLTVDDKSTLAYAYHLVGNRELAEQNILQAGEMVNDTKTRLIYSYWQYKMHQHDTDSIDACRWLEISDSLKSLLMDEALAKSIQPAEIEYYKSVNETNKEQLDEKKFRINLVLFFSIPILALCIIGTMTFFKSNKKKTIQYKRTLKTLSQDNKHLNKAIDEYYQNIKNGEWFGFLNELIETYYERKGTSKAKDAVFSQLESFIKKAHDEKSLQLEMEKTINLLSDNIVLRLREECPRLNENDYMLFTLLAMRFSFITIGVLMSLEPEQVYRLKYKLKQKIKNSESQHKGRFMEILS